MAPAFAQFEQKYKDKVTIIPVDVSKPENTAKYQKYKGSRYIPETVVLRKGEIVDQHTGSMTLEQLEQQLAKGL
mgnify:CR=1 FL=1